MNHSDHKMKLLENVRIVPSYPAVRNFPHGANAVPSWLKTFKKIKNFALRESRQSIASIMFVSDIPPCSNYSGGIFVNHMLASIDYAVDDIFVVLNPVLRPAVAAEVYDRLCMAVENKPSEQYYDIEALEEIRSKEIASGQSVTDKLLPSLLEFAKDRGSRGFWVLLEGQTMIRLAFELLKSSKLPVHVQVLDPPRSWLRAHGADPVSTAEVLKKFDYVLNKARSIAAASPNMAEYYRKLYGDKTTTVLPSLPEDLARAEFAHERSARMLIGFAGQLYANNEWKTLLEALDQLSWRINDKDVEIVVFAQHSPKVEDRHASRIHIKEWAPTSELISELSRCHLLYCPYLFDPAWKEDAELCFPSKLTTYLATGRLVFFHGPEYASPAKFLRDTKAGFVSNAQTPSGLAADLRKATESRFRMRQLSRNGARAFLKHLSYTPLRNSLRRFLSA